jgi:hypothetical protein
MKKNIVGTEDVSGKGISPDCGVRCLVQVGQVLQGALAEVLQSCNGPQGVTIGTGRPDSPWLPMEIPKQPAQ